MYFDNAATTVASDKTVELVNRYMKNLYGNAGSIHFAGTSVKKAMNEARSVIAECINADAEQIVFTSGGSEANSLAIIGLMRYLKKIGKPCIVASQIEHLSVLSALEYMDNNGFSILKLPVDRNGIVNIDTLKRRIEQYHIGLVSVMSVNNEIGCIQNVADIGKLCRKNNILFHTDCVQAAGTIKIDVEEMCIDFLTMSGHKFHAPKGVGFLYARDKDLLSPIIFGGGQEFTLRSGTENIPGIVSMAQALKDVYETPVSYSDIKKCFVERIEELCRKENIEVVFNGDSKTNLSKIVNLRFPGVDGQTLLLMCSSKGVYVSAGSACKANANNPSHVLRAIGLSEEDALSSIRVSFSRYNTIEEATSGAEIIIQCVKEMESDAYVPR